MYILDPDHVSVLDRGGVKAQHLLQKLASIAPAQLATSIISYEEQMRGWLSYTAKVQTIEKQVKAYKELKRQLTNLNHESFSQKSNRVILNPAALNVSRLTRLS